MNEGEKIARREAARQAAEDRAKSFKQGGGGETIKAKAKKLDVLREKSSSDRDDGKPAMRWTVG